jgi:hypothetical protein
MRQLAFRFFLFVSATLALGALFAIPYLSL